LDTVATLPEKTSEESTTEVSERIAVAAGKKMVPSEYQALYKRAFQFMGGTVVLFLIGFVSFPILARVFTVEQYGLVALVSNTVAVAVVFSKCGLQTSVQRFYK
jgi:uncharacterized membrane protein YccC